MASFMNKLQEKWCYFMHPDPMWPVNGRYRCPQCLREHAVVWEQDLAHSRKPAPLPAQAPALVTPEPAHSGLRLVRATRGHAAA